MNNLNKDIYKDGSYWTKNPTFHEEDALFKAKSFIEIIEKNNINITSLLDLGCGSGKFLNELYKWRNQIDYLGIDVSNDIIKRAIDQNNKNIKFECITFEKIKKKISIVTLNDVFEHVENYISFLKSVRGLADYYYFNIPLDMNVLSVLFHKYQNFRKELGHLHYFSKKSALETLIYCDYKIVDFKYNISVFHSLKTKPSLSKLIALFPRLFLNFVSKDLGTHLLGGSSLSVICK